MGTLVLQIEVGAQLKDKQHSFSNALSLVSRLCQGFAKEAANQLLSSFLLYFAKSNNKQRGAQIGAIFLSFTIDLIR